LIPALAAIALLAGPHAEPAGGVRWERNWEQAVKKAQAAHKPLLIDFWADWCGWCRRLDRTTYLDPTVVRLAQEFVAVKVNTEGAPREVAIAARYEVGTLPTILFISPSGRPVHRLTGYQGPGQFPLTLEQARVSAAKVMAWEAVLERSPGDAAALLGLASHLFDQEAYAESRGLLDRAIHADAQRPAPQRKQARLLLAVMLKTYDENFVGAEALLKEGLAIAPAGEMDPSLLYALGKTYLAWGRRDQARATFQEIVASHAESPVAQKARETLVALDRRH